MLFVRLLLLIVFLGLHPQASSDTTADDDQFVYSGFRGSALTVDGTAAVTSDGVLLLTNGTAYLKGHAFHPTPLRLRDSPNGSVQSFSVAFVFGIVSVYPDFSAHGMALLIAPGKDFSSALPAKYLGLTNVQNDGNASNHLLAVELDTIQSVEFKDINANHVGIDVNGLQSLRSYNAGYYDDGSGEFQNLKLISRQAMTVWVDYSGDKKQINVTLAPLLMATRPARPLLSVSYDLSTVLTDIVYLGFTSATGRVNSRHCVLGWSFGKNRPAPAIDVSKLPDLPRAGPKPGSKVLEIVLPIVTGALVLCFGGAGVLLVRRRFRYAELREDWEVEFGPHRFSYKDLYQATDGFKDKNLLGEGGFGRVYKGVLVPSMLEVAVKRVSHESRQGMKEFVAEIASIGRIRHRNLVQLLGYCRRKGELLLVYEYMPNGSLDKYLYSSSSSSSSSSVGEICSKLRWAQRFHIIKGVASGLLYLHERWEKVVVHRDIKASNVLLDADMNAQLGDFGLARLYDHGTDSQTTHVVGTVGYLSPELLRTGKASPLTDVFAFGIFLMELTCGQKPIKENEQGGGGGGHVMLVDWVLQHWRNGSLVATVDAGLRGEYDVGEAELVLKLGILCSHPFANARPGMGQVMRYLDGVTPLPELTPTDSSFDVLAMMMQGEDFGMSSFSHPDTVASFGTISNLSGGR
ncbi:hypothetical protein BDA96_10G155000 [Sorghum bicolor]|uniref:non-specific serine/threonine protein kinase n=1 Tax=Sorghum bicolor TaxID=4558 RepID=A0A921Q2C7_SORBI|nr:L-type lectin-domain containing receptor kinase IV.1 [Sorghum bicolor]KAG0514037.1 hypothetical protein BDA96_10G155000 [Sorghum bicolor]|eukprot:XP_021306196.1 L-type lectin-domain containing receptor kinase IV.1 [Sorghum bicolor]